MTITAYIMIKIEGMSNRHVLDKIIALDETKEAFIIFGAFDIIVKAEFKSNDDMSIYVVEKLKAIEGVGETQTNVCATC
ncbi:MAG: Lrp/AsnC family transcriptional regulator [Candidatus Thorarchaeota archaeon]|nr:Lrp/AsnC family transcriptional regulator [Candidatus Thorarchaeota archaeon]